MVYGSPYFFIFCFAIGFCGFGLKSKIKKCLFAVAFVVYIFGFFTANKAVRDACTHGNCKHGWYSKKNKTEKAIAFLWVLTPISLLFFIIRKRF